jgi:hypothetical protein
MLRPEIEARPDARALAMPGRPNGRALIAGPSRAGAAMLVYLIACGLIGEPVPPVMISGAPQKKNS